MVPTLQLSEQATNRRVGTELRFYGIETSGSQLSGHPRSVKYRAAREKQSLAEFLKAQ
jgi:hypothetical protein